MDYAGRTIVVVDVQPAYCTRWPANGDLMRALGAHDADVVMLVNSDRDGLTPDTIDDCRIFWDWHGMPSDMASSVPVVDKGYGHLRAWMDNGVDRDVIVRVLRRMIETGVTDSRDMDDDLLHGLCGDRYEDWMPEEPMSLGWIDDHVLEGWQDVVTCGGGRDECLLELEILMDAYGIRHERIEAFVYADDYSPTPFDRPRSFEW